MEERGGKKSLNVFRDVKKFPQIYADKIRNG